MIPIISIPLAFIGFLDDLYEIKPLIKYFFQVITSINLIIFSNLFSDLAINLNSFIIVIALTILFTGIINFINFMDGLDGLVSGCMFISIGASCIILEIGEPYILLLGSISAFIIWNWHPAKVFMGDVGSTFLAAINIGLITQSDNFYKAIGLLLIMTPCLIDPLSCLIRRLINGQNIFKAHKLHLYQRLYLSGIKQYKVAFLYLSVTLLLALTQIYFEVLSTLIVAILTVILGIYLDIKLSRPFKIASKYSIK